MSEVEIDVVIKKIIGSAYTVHNTLGPGFLEKVYENSLVLELERGGLNATQQESIPVYYRETRVGEFFADIVVENAIVVELKAIQHLAPEHEVQLVNYLSATGKDDGLLINFGQSVEVKRKFRVYKPKS